MQCKGPREPGALQTKHSRPVSGVTVFVRTTRADVRQDGEHFLICIFSWFVRFNFGGYPLSVDTFIISVSGKRNCFLSTGKGLPALINGLACQNPDGKPRSVLPGAALVPKFLT